MESTEVGHIDTLTQESFLIFSKNKGKHSKNQRCKNPNFRRRSSNTENDDDDDDDSFNNRENFCNSDIPNLQLLGINILRLFKLIYIKKTINTCTSSKRINRVFFLSEKKMEPTEVGHIDTYYKDCKIKSVDPKLQLLISKEKVEPMDIDEMREQVKELKKEFKVCRKICKKIIKENEKTIKKNEDCLKSKDEHIKFLMEIIKNNEEDLKEKDRRIKLLMETIRLKYQRIHHKLDEL